MRLNWGCGIKRFHMAGWLNIDYLSKCEPDVRHDIMVVPWFAGSLKNTSTPNGTVPAILPDNSVEAIRADNLLEHIPLPRDTGEDRLRDVLNEAHRVLRPGGVFWIRVPDVEEWPWGAFRDPTHCRFWCAGSFDYWTVNHQTWRNYGSSYGYRPWQVSVTKETGHGQVFLVASMSPVEAGS